MTATGRRLVDLSHPIPRTPSRAAGTKGLRGFAASWSNIFETKLAETALLFFLDQVSTHIDAPAHFHPGGKTIDQMEPELVVEVSALLLDVSHKPDGAPLEPGELQAAVAAKGETVRAGDVVLLYTGASRHWGQARYFSRIVPLAPDTVRWLVGRGVRVIGVDAEEIDADQYHWPAHMLLRELEFYIIENLALWPAVLELPTRFTVVAAPLCIRGATGAPVRVVAVL
jgi:kynurenine formamidase